MPMRWHKPRKANAKNSIHFPDASPLVYHACSLTAAIHDRLGFSVPKFCSSASTSSCSLFPFSGFRFVLSTTTSARRRAVSKRNGCISSARRRNEGEENCPSLCLSNNESWFYKKRPSWPSSHSLRMRSESKGDFSISSPNTSIALALNSWPLCVLLGVRL
jgi:hypothetical protein